MIVTLILAIARAVLSERAVKLLEGWLKPAKSEDGFQAIRTAGEAAQRAGKEPTDNDPNRKDPL